VFDEIEKHLVKGLKIKDKDEIILCDAVVLCQGSFLARFLKRNLDIVCPVVPVKGYSFDVPTSVDHAKMHFAFKDIAFVAVMLEGGIMRIAAFGDLSGQDKSFDPRRVRFLKSIVAERFDKAELHNYQNLNTCLRPVPPDDVPIVGNLKLYPNVFINGGHSGRGTTVGLSTSKLISE